MATLGVSYNASYNEVLREVRRQATEKMLKPCELPLQITLGKGLAGIKAEIECSLHEEDVDWAKGKDAMYLYIRPRFLVSNFVLTGYWDCYSMSSFDSTLPVGVCLGIYRVMGQYGNLNPIKSRGEIRDGGAVLKEYTRGVGQEILNITDDVEWRSQVTKSKLFQDLSNIQYIMIGSVLDWKCDKSRGQDFFKAGPEDGYPLCKVDIETQNVWPYPGFLSVSHYMGMNFQSQEIVGSIYGMRKFASDLLDGVTPLNVVTTTKKLSFEDKRVKYFPDTYFS